MNKKVLITGSAGLLGREVTDVFIKNRYSVLAQYNKNRSLIPDGALALKGDFTDSESIENFISQNKSELEGVESFVHLYGPLVRRDISENSTRDFEEMYFSNVLVFWELFSYLKENSLLKNVLAVSFKESRERESFKTVLPYSCAKRSLETIVKSIDEYIGGVSASLVYIPSLKGAEHVRTGEVPASPELWAGEIYKRINGE